MHVAQTTVFFGRWGRVFLLCLFLVAIGCSQPHKREQQGRSSGKERQSSRVIKKDNPDAGKEANAQTGETELWLFGTSDAKLTEPFDARGVRVIIDLRTLKPQQAISFLGTLANRDLGIAICIRWKNPNHGSDRARGRENFDVPPTPQESDRALEQLRQILSSEPAKKIGKRLYVQVYNEIGGGPGRFALEDVDGMFAFADRVVPVIRSANPNVKISGPALSGGQLSQVGNEPKNEANRIKAEVIERWIKWTVANADVTDVHLNGVDVDAEWADNALTNMRKLLDDHGGQHIGLISLEWSCSGYPNRSDAAGTRAYIHGVWETMNKHGVQVAAYTYWPLFNMPEEMRSKTSWASVIGENNKPNQVVWDTLVEIGKER